MKRLTTKVTRALLILCAGLLIATSLPGGSVVDQSAAAPAAPAPTAFFEPPRAAPSGAQPFVMILCKFADVDETWQTPADFERLLFGPEGLDAYWREASYGRINLEGSRAVGWYTLPGAVEAYRDGDGSDVDLGRLAADCTAAADADIHFPDYAGIGMAFNRNLWLSSRGGRMCLDLDSAAKCYGALWLWPTNARNRALVAHEMGHAFGLSHSTGASAEEFGNAWDVMSQDGQWWPDAHYNPPPQHMIAYHKDTLGWIEAHRKYVVADEGTVAITLERLAQPGASGYLLAQVPIAGSAEHFYTAETRRMAGFDAQLPADAVVIHEIDTAKDAPAMLVSPKAERDLRSASSMWRVGQRFVDEEHGIAISVDAETETGFVVTISTTPQPWPITPPRRKVVAVGNVSFTWHAVAGARHYELRVEPQIGTPSVQEVGITLSTTGIRVPLTPGTYTWRVRALPTGEWSVPQELGVSDAVIRWRTSAVPLVESAREVAKPGFALNSLGNAYFVYSEVPGHDANDMSNELRVASRVSGVWQAATPFSVNQTAASGGIAIASSQPSGLTVLIASPMHLWSFEYSVGDAWRTLKKVDDDVKTGLRSNPMIAVDDTSNAYAVWIDMRNGDTDVYFAYRPNGGEWGRNEKVNDDLNGALQWSPALAVDAWGNAYAIWADERRGATGIYTAFRPVGGEWGTNIRLSAEGTANRSPTLAVDGSGNLYAAWVRSSGAIAQGEVVFAMRSAGGDWGPLTAISAGNRGVYAPKLVADKMGDAYAAWDEETDTGFALYSAFRPANGAWGPQVRVIEGADNKTPSEPTLAVDEAGTAYVAWVDSSDALSMLRLSTGTRR